VRPKEANQYCVLGPPLSTVHPPGRVVVPKPYGEEESVMSSQTTLLSILAVIIAGFVATIWVSTVINSRGDEISSGVVKGIPVPAKARWLMLFTQFLTFYLFLVGFLMIIGLGLWELAQGVEEPAVSLLGYMGAYLSATGAVMWLLLGTSWFIHHLSVVRQAKAD
jgi:amino acid transporter